jgi:hypothetical protein
MRVIINGVVAGLAEHPRLAYLSQHQWKLDLISSYMIFAVTESVAGHFIPSGVRQLSSGSSL